MASLVQDIRFGLRVLARNRGFTIVAIVTLSLGIGVNTAFLSLADAVLVRPFPVRSPERLVALYTMSKADSKLERTSYQDYLDYKSLTAVFAGVSAFVRMPFDVKTGQWAERVEGELVSGDYFAVLGMSMALGRGFLHEEDQDAASHPAAVVSYGFWQRKLGADPAALGRKVLLDGHPFTVVGVAPQGFGGMALDREALPEIWVPMAMHGVNADPSTARYIAQARDFRWLEVIARLKDGVSLDQAKSAARVRAGVLEKTFPEADGGRTVAVLPQSEARFWPAHRNSVLSILALLLTSSGLVLLIACVNVANLLLVNASTRHQEVAIRSALGAGRSRVARQFLTEGFLLSSVGLGFSLLITDWVFGFLTKYPQLLSVPMTLGLAVDMRVFGIASLLSTLTAAALGIFPALQALRTDLRGTLQRKDRASGSAPAVSRLRGALVAVQVAISLVPLAGAGLFLRTVQKAEALDTGYRDENVLVLTVDFSRVGYRYDDAKGMRLLRRLLDRVHKLPGVRSATLSGDLPLANRRLLLRFVKETDGAVGDRDWIQVDANIIGPRYFETLGIPIISGRDFSDNDDEVAPGAIIINQSMAERYWPGENPVGKSLKIRARIPGSREVYRVVGVSKNLRQRSLWEETGPYACLPFYQRYFPEMMLMVKTEGNPRAFLPAVVAEIHSLDDDLPIYGTGLLSEQVARALSPQRMAAAFLSAAGFLALVLAAVGVYGVVSYAVVRRRHEIGIRMALGAGRKPVLRLLLREVMTMVGIGLVLGLAAALALSRTVASLLYGVSPSDPATYAVIMIVLATVSLVACYLPARRASLDEPSAGLRCE